MSLMLIGHVEAEEFSSGEYQWLSQTDEFKRLVSAEMSMMNASHREFLVNLLKESPNLAVQVRQPSVLVILSHLISDETAEAIKRFIETDVSFGDCLLKLGGQLLQIPHAPVLDLCAVKYAETDLSYQTWCPPALSPMHVSLLVLQKPLCSEDGCRLAHQGSRCVLELVKAGFAAPGGHYFFFQAPTTPPLDLQRMHHHERYDNLIPFFVSQGFVHAGEEGAPQLTSRRDVFVLISFDVVSHRSHLAHFKSYLARLGHIFLVFPSGPLRAFGGITDALQWPVDVKPSKQNALRLTESRFECDAPPHRADCTSVTHRLGIPENSLTLPLFLTLRRLDRHGDIGYSALNIIRRFYREWHIPTDCGLLTAFGNNLRASLTREDHPGSVEPAEGFRIRLNPLDNPVAAAIAEVEKALGPLREGCSRLYHGTADHNAEAILKSGIDLERCSPHSDFGRAFYTTSDLEYAINAAITASTVSSRTPALLVYTITQGTAHPLTNMSTYQLAAPEWNEAVAAYRKQNTSQKQRLPPLLRDADILSGAISRNASDVDCGRAAIPSPFLQTAFRTSSSISILEQFPTAVCLLDDL
jgi:hypothetical protein